jgi:hypothetical protein
MAITSRKHCGAYRNSLAICRASAEACQRAAIGLSDLMVLSSPDGIFQEVSDPALYIQSNNVLPLQMLDIYSAMPLITLAIHF